MKALQISFTLLIAWTPCPSQAFKGVRKDTSLHVQEAVTCKNCFITHEPCPDNQGLGSSTRQIHEVLNLAVSLNMTYLCKPDDWSTDQHATGRLGFLFGCNSEDDVFGDRIAALSHLPQGLASKTAHILPGGRFPPSLNKEYLDVPVQDDVLYKVIDDCSPDPVKHVPMPDFGRSYVWLRSQFHQVRKQNATRRNPKCWLKTNITASAARCLSMKHDFNVQVNQSWGTLPLRMQREWGKLRCRDYVHAAEQDADALKFKKKIAVHIRRGDDASGRGPPLDFYMQALDRVFGCKRKDLCIKESDAHIVIQSQHCSASQVSDNACHSDEELFAIAAKYKLSVVTYELGTFPERDPHVAHDELVASLDCMSVADVLITSGGGFSDLAAALLHDEGRSLNLHPITHTDVPNAIHASDFTGPTVGSSYLFTESLMNEVLYAFTRANEAAQGIRGIIRLVEHYMAL